MLFPLIRTVKAVSVFLFILCILMGCSTRPISGKDYKTLPSKLISSKSIDVYPIYKKEVEAFEIKYTVDTLKITGYILKPVSIAGKSPMIIYNRGGNRDFGTVDQQTLAYLAYLAAQGYVVMASQYRGNIYSDGIDEFGGEDVKDVLALMDIAKNLAYADNNNIGVLGYSRGGLMAYLMSNHTDKIKALAVVGAPTDVFQTCQERPEMYHEVLLPLVGDSIGNRMDYIDRSPVYWAKAVNEPVLILHGSADTKVNIKQAEMMITVLRNNEQTFCYKLFDNGTHSLENFREQRDSIILDWFNKHLNKGISDSHQKGVICHE